jgi:hypothetical protein
LILKDLTIPLTARKAEWDCSFSLVQDYQGY